MIRESSGVYRRSVSFRVYGDQCLQQSQEAKEPVGPESKAPKSR